MTSRRVALVLSGGGARGAYEAGVLAHLVEHVFPRLGPGFEFDILSGTSVGAVHAAYMAATVGGAPAERAAHIAETWERMVLGDVLQLRVLDLIGIPLRALGVTRLARTEGRSRPGLDVLGGLVDVSPLERLIHERVPWDRLCTTPDCPPTLCVSTTEVRSGGITIFMNGPLADPTPWQFDPNARAIRAAVAERHVRASAAIPFLFPAVRIGDRYYVDGGLRMNTPLSPALRLGADRVLVVGLRHAAPGTSDAPAYPEDVIAQPAFLFGKVLNAMMLDQLEYEIQRVGLVNALLEHGTTVYGDEFLGRINEAVREQRGVGFRHVSTVVVRPSEDLGRIAARCNREHGSLRLGFLPALLTRLALRGVPEDEADLLSYLLFDRCFTTELVALGRADARAAEDAILSLLA